MRIGELARRAGVSINAVRYDERTGLIEPVREDNGHRSFADEHVRAATEARELSGLGIPPQKAGPFVERLGTGHEHGDERISSLAVHRDTLTALTALAALAALAELAELAELDRMIASLSGRRDVLGMSSRHPAYQAEVVERLRPPFAMISDEALPLADALRLPSFPAPGHDRLCSRLTLVVLDGSIEHVFHPLFPPNAHAREVLHRLRGHGRRPTDRRHPHRSGSLPTDRDVTPVPVPVPVSALPLLPIPRQELR